MEVRQARHFLAVVDHGTTGRAAAELHMTQPALSQSIVALERELRVRLFLRSTRGMALTPAGEALIGPARRLVESSVRAVAAVEQSIDVPHGTLNVSVMPALAATPVSTWIAWFRDAYPQVSVRLSPYFGDETVTRVFDRDHAEVLVSFVGEPGPGRVQRVEVGSQEMVVALPPGTPVPDGPTVQLEDIAHLPFVVAPPHTSMQRILQDAFDKIGSTLSVAVETPFMDTMPALVAAGAGCAIFPARGAETLRALGAVVKHPEPPIDRPYYLFYAAHRLSYAAQAFIRTATSEGWPWRPSS
ncbi:LysR family transcriptional regulator [Pseudonocardia yuanmonensis]|uniref:LysR family transcriptional regulator n=1 Tax=Pseudonocardia yuanmonensis TaxID=1095914 RepID=UPI0031EDFCB1